MNDIVKLSCSSITFCDAGEVEKPFFFFLLFSFFSLKKSIRD